MVMNSHEWREVDCALPSLPPSARAIVTYYALFSKPEINVTMAGKAESGVGIC
jgi:hypothetical protein